MQKLTIEQMKMIAREHGGECLSSKYVNAHTELKWRCTKGHEWKAKPMYIIRCHWCHECGGSKELSIVDAKRLASEKSGKCLSKKYSNAHLLLTWECSKGHVWESSLANIKYGKAWCPRCSQRKKSTIEDMQHIAKQRGGECLSKKYLDATTNLLWQCSAGHVWEATPASIMRRSWCGRCSGNSPLSIEEMQKIAENRGGRSLSKKYTNSSTKIRWRCADGHEWSASPSSIKMGSWCPECGLRNVAENICREIFESIFNKKFPKTKPEWLVNADGNRMEFDGYNKSLHLAFEYHGEQHFKNSPFFYRGIDEKFNKRKIDDKTKKLLSENKEIRLVEIPFTIDVLDLYEFITKKCDQLGVQIPKHKYIDVSKIQSTYRAKNLIELSQIAQKRGGRLISKIYLGTNSKHIWVCSEGHEWMAAPHNIKQGKWCPQCSKESIGNLTRLNIEQMNELAMKRGGKCKSTEYVNAGTKLEWQCVKGHIWETTPNKIQQGRWCAKCARRYPLDINQMRDIAESRGGKCLSQEYVNARTGLMWRCANGHDWMAVADSIKRGSWCGKCSVERRKK